MRRARAVVLAAALLAIVITIGTAPDNALQLPTIVRRTVLALSNAYDDREGIGLPCAPVSWVDDPRVDGVVLSRPACWLAEEVRTPHGHGLRLHDPRVAMAELIVLPSGGGIELPGPALWRADRHDVGSRSNPTVEIAWTPEDACGAPFVALRVPRIFSCARWIEATLAVADAIAQSIHPAGPHVPSVPEEAR